jgi:hypothetical protein
MSENKETFNRIMNMEIHTLDETSMNNVSKMWCFIEKQNEEISELKDRIEYWKKEALNDFSESNEIVHEFSRANKRLALALEGLRFYADKGNWNDCYIQCAAGMSLNQDDQEHFDNYDSYGGKTARETIAKIEGEG